MSGMSILRSCTNLQTVDTVQPGCLPVGLHNIPFWMKQPVRRMLKQSTNKSDKEPGENCISPEICNPLDQALVIIYMKMFNKVHVIQSNPFR